MSKDYNHKECMLALARALRNIAAGLEKYPEECIGERDGGVSMKDISVRVPHQRDKYGDVDYAKVSCSYTMDDDCAALRDEPMYRTVKHHTDESSPNLFRDKVFSMLWVYFLQEFPEAVWEHGHDWDCSECDSKYEVEYRTYTTISSDGMTIGVPGVPYHVCGKCGDSVLGAEALDKIERARRVSHE